jgi:hypothetical protein
MVKFVSSDFRTNVRRKYFNRNIQIHTYRFAFLFEIKNNINKEEKKNEKRRKR